MLELKKNKKFLIVVAHPDDELLGLGGTICKLKQRDDVYIKVVILGEGITSRFNNEDKKSIRTDLTLHKQNILAAKDILGYDDLATYDLPDNKFDTVPLLDIIKIVEKEKQITQPDVVFTHHNGDVNIDHQLTFRAVITAFRSLPNDDFGGILTFETPSGTEWIPPNDPRKFEPNIFVELSKELIEKKVMAMESYEFEKRDFPHPRSPQSLFNRSIMWGVTAGVEYAEPFQLIKYILRNENK